MGNKRPRHKNKRNYLKIVGKIVNEIVKRKVNKMKKYMTKKEAFNLFKECYVYVLNKHKNDQPMKTQLWNYFTDSLCKEGRISEKQYSNWTNPF